MTKIPFFIQNGYLHKDRFKNIYNHNDYLYNSHIYKSHKYNNIFL
jgi:hypothetical protein